MEPMHKSQLRSELPDSVSVWDKRKGEYVVAWLKDYRRQERFRFLDGVVFNANTTSKVSEQYYCAPFREFRLFVDLAVASTPTDITFEIEFSHDGARWFKYMDGPFGSLMYEDGAGNKKESVCGKCYAEYMRIKATATGTDGTKKFTTTVDAVFSA